MLMAELLEGRCKYLKRNFPEAEIVETDLTVDERSTGWLTVVSRAEEALGGKSPHLLVATPPCQGMSTNGAGKIARAVERGDRPKLDPRNRLVLSALEIAERLRPKWVVLENVVPMRNTVIEYGGAAMNILRIVDGRLARIGYRGGAATVDFGRHGVPQDRSRLITVYGLKWDGGVDGLLPPEIGEPATLRQAIGHFEKLDAHGATHSADDPLHRVKKMNDNHYWWTSRIPKSSGGTAYDNPCGCGWNSEPKTGKQGGEGCPAYCARCGGAPAEAHRSGEEGRFGEADNQRIQIVVQAHGVGQARADGHHEPDDPLVRQQAASGSEQDALAGGGGGHPDGEGMSGRARGLRVRLGRHSDRELCNALGEGVPPLFFERLLRHLAEK